MEDNGIEDILIGENDNSTNKKGKKSFIIIFILLLLILVLMIGFYYYTVEKEKSSAKELFLTNLMNTDIKNILDNNIYTEILNRTLTENSETTSNINFSSTLENIDFSKFVLELSTQNDVTNSKAYGELGINYSGNEIFRLKLLSNETGSALRSDEIVTKYVGIHYDSIKNMTGININSDTIKNLKKIQKINLTDEQKKEYMQKYLMQISNNINKENCTIQDNFVIQKNSEYTSATAYTLKLNQDELKNLIVSVLYTLKNDEKFINEFVTGEEKNKILNITEDELNNTINTMSEPGIEENEDLEQNIEESQNVLDLEQNEELPEEVAPQLEDNNSVLDVNPELETNNIMPNIDFNFDTDINLDIIKLLLGIKIDSRVEDIKDQIDDVIEKVKVLEGNGITFTIYVTDLGTEKINIVLPNGNTLDLEFTKKSEQQDFVKITYLYKGRNSGLGLYNGEDIQTYSAINELEGTSISEKENSSQKNGFSLEIDKTKKDANSTLRAVYSFIENEKITKKININLKTDGTLTSKNIKNSLVISTSGDGSNGQVTLDNTIKFTEVEEIEDLTLDNCVFLDNLNNEELSATINEVYNKILSVYNEKMQRLNFIDTNTHSSIISNNISSNVTYNEAREALITRVSNMMRDAIDRGEEFTIQNLKDLTIDGYEVSSVITDTVAVIVVDVYTFNIDTEFHLTDA